MDLPTFITFMVMWMLLVFGGLFIWFSYRQQRHIIDLNHKERMTALENGLEMPAASVESRAGFPARHRHWGVVLTLLGGSLMLVLGVNAGLKGALWGLPAVAIGVAHLIQHALSKGEQKSQKS